jgi:hypothetical protein
MPELPGHERRERRRERRMGRRLVRSGEEFTSDELDNGEVELEEVEPSAPPPDEEGASEPWSTDKDWAGRLEQLRAYREFLRERGEDNEAEVSTDDSQ